MNITFKIYNWGKSEPLQFTHNEEREVPDEMVLSFIGRMWDSGYNAALIRTGENEAIVMAYTLAKEKK